MFGTIMAIAALPVLLILKGFFSGAEIALVNADRMHLQHIARGGHRGARLALRLLESPERLLSTTLIGTNIATVTLVAIGTGMAIDLAGPGGDVYAILVLTPLLLVLGEVVPKSVYQQKANTIAPSIIFPLWSLTLLLAPIILVFSAVARLVARVAGFGGARSAVLVTKNMIRSVVQMADRASGLESFDRARIQRATHFTGRRVGEVVIPISEVPCVPTTASMAAVLDVVRAHGVYRVPVYDGSVARVTGVVPLSVWQILDGVEPAQPVAEVVRPPLYVVEAQRASDLVPVLRERDDKMAIVVGDQGQAIGVVTLEAILAGVSGPVDVGFRSAPHGAGMSTAVERRDEDTYVLGGRVPLATLAEVLDVEVAAMSGYTVGGFINHAQGRLSGVGDEVTVEDWTLSVVEASASEVLQVRARRHSRSREQPSGS